MKRLELNVTDIIKVSRSLGISAEAVVALESKSRNKNPKYRSSIITDVMWGSLSKKDIYNKSTDTFLKDWDTSIDTILDRSYLQCRVNNVELMDTVIPALHRAIVPENFHLKKVRMVIEEVLDKNEPLIFIWEIIVHIWPNDPDHNEQWNTLFGATYKGMRLRRNDRSKIQWFRRLAENDNYDVSVIMMAAFYYVKNCIKSKDETYVTKFEKFQDDFESWYEETEDIIEGSSIADVWDSFVPNYVKSPPTEKEKYEPEKVSSGFRRG
jgi:hypothetical protein